MRGNTHVRFGRRAAETAYGNVGIALWLDLTSTVLRERGCAIHPRHSPLGSRDCVPEDPAVGGTLYVCSP
jgi:hypothetical protein